MKMSWKNEASNNGERVVVPTGTYKVQISGWQECHSSKGNPQIRWFADILDPETVTKTNEDGVEEQLDLKGKSLCEHTVLVEKALFRTANLVMACGIDLDETPDMEIGSEPFKKMLDACLRRTTFWHVIEDTQYMNNKIESYTADPDQERTVVTFEDEPTPF